MTRTQLQDAIENEVLAYYTHDITEENNYEMCTERIMALIDEYISDWYAE